MDNLAQAEGEISNFHQSLDAGQFEDIYNKAGDGFKTGTPKAETLAFLEAVHRKLGKVKETKRGTWNVTHNTSGHFVTVQYETEFIEGKGTESFVYTISGSKVYLYSYNVNSTALVIK
jgi:hypothetical protein